MALGNGGGREDKSNRSKEAAEEMMTVAEQGARLQNSWITDGLYFIPVYSHTIPDTGVILISPSSLIKAAPHANLSLLEGPGSQYNHS